MQSLNKNIKPLYIPKSKKFKGLAVSCSFCNSEVGETCKDNGKSIKQCSHPEKLSFKATKHISGTRNARKTKKIETRNLDEAILEAVKFFKEVNELGQQVPIIIKSEKKSEIKNEVTDQPKLLIHCLVRYIGFLNNEGVGAHRFKQRSTEHIKDIERAFKLLVECLKHNKIDIKTLSIDDLNDKIIGILFSYLNDKGFSNRTFNKYLTYFTMFLNWYADEYNYPLRNWFKRIERKPIITNPESITGDEYKALLKQITLENGTKDYKNGVKPIRNMFRPWLENGIRLALETGRRREEIINLKWKNIVDDNKEGQYIICEDIKVNRIKNRVTEADKKLIYIPVTDSLAKLLSEMGFDSRKGQDEFILAPEINNSRNRVMSDTLSRGFSHYYKQLNTGRNLTFKSLRKAYITNLQIHMGGNAKSITGHSDNGVIQRNYIDKKEIAKVARHFNVFESDERGEELKQIRQENKTQHKNREVE